MSARIYKLTAAGSTNLTAISPNGGGANLAGYDIYNTAASARFVKFYWGVPGKFSGGGMAPTVGTDIPNLTVGIAATSQWGRSLAIPCNASGALFFATTVNAADTDTTAVTAGDLIISVFYE